MGIKDYLPLVGRENQPPEPEGSPLQEEASAQELLGNQAVQERMAESGGGDDEPDDESPSRGIGVYVIQPGDLLGELARKGTGSVGRYRELNTFNGREPEDGDIEVGDIFSIPEGWDLEAMGASPNVQAPDPTYIELLTVLMESESPESEVCRELWNDLDEEHRDRVLADPNLRPKLTQALAPPRGGAGAVVEAGLDLAGDAMEAALQRWEAVAEWWAGDPAGGDTQATQTPEAGAQEAEPEEPGFAEGSVEERAKRLGTTDGSSFQVADDQVRWNLIGKRPNIPAWREAQDSGKAFAVGEIQDALEGQEGEAYVEAANREIEEKDFSKDQRALIEAARDFARNPKPLDAEQQANASISWSKLTMDSTSVDSRLIQRMELFQKFIAWAGLVVGPTEQASGMRSKKTAHALSVAWMFSPNNTKSSSRLTTPDRQRRLVDVLVEIGGRDADGNQWVEPELIERLQEVREDDGALNDLIEHEVREQAGRVRQQNAQAAEGYEEADKRRPNLLRGGGVSNHLKGKAVDVFQQWIFPNVYDPVIDAIAMYFGVYRACKDLSSSPEHWHYELIGTPPAPAEAEAGSPEE